MFCETLTPLLEDLFEHLQKYIATPNAPIASTARQIPAIAPTDRDPELSPKSKYGSPSTCTVVPSGSSW